MAMIPITTVQQTGSVSQDASVLITQPVEGRDATVETLQRSTLAAVAEALKAAGIGTGLAYASNIEAVEGGIKVTFGNGEVVTVDVGSGLAFDAVTFDSESGDLHITLDGVDVVEPCHIGTGGGGGGGYGSIMRVLSRSAKSMAITDKDTTAKILYTVTSVDETDQSPTGDIFESWSVGSTKVATRSVHQGENEMEMRPYLVNGTTNTVKLVAEDAYGNSRTMTWTVTVSTFGLTWNLDDISYDGAYALPVTLTPTGQGDKTLKVTVDGTEIYNSVVTTSGRTVSVTVPSQSHGSHVVEAWIEATVNGDLVTTDKLRHVGIWSRAGSTTPVIAVYDDTPEIAVYGTCHIRYIVYDPENEETLVTMGEVGGSQTAVRVDRLEHDWPYKATKEGEINLQIVCGSVTKSITMTVTGSGYDIKPVTEGIVMDLDPAGHTNSEVGRENFGYADGAGINHPLTFSSNFDWNHGGFQVDEDGVTAFVVKRGTSVTFDRSLFSENAKSRGKNIKLIYKSTNVRDYDAELMSCVSGTVGLRVQAQTAYIGSELDSFNVPYTENRKIEMDVNIEPTNEHRFAMVCLKGIPSRTMVYSDTDSWQQTSAAMLTIAPTECDVWLYRLKMYDHSLTRYDIMDNYIADCSDTEEMISRYERNAVYNDDGSTINIEKLSQANRRLRILNITCDRMTTSKEDEVTCSVALVYADGGGEYTFTASNVIMKVQGTSSAAYGAAAYNIDLDFKNAFWTNGNGETITKFAMAEGCIPVKYFNIKLNVASSENANNVIFADEYNQFQPHLIPERDPDSEYYTEGVRDTVQGFPCAVFLTNSSAVPFVTGSRTVPAGGTMFYGIGDMNNSKKNNEVFAQDNSRWSKQCCIEFLNNDDLPCRYKETIKVSEEDTGAGIYEKFDGDGSFEFRYPKSPTQEMKDAFKAMLDWVVSTDTEAATNGPLDTAVVYNGKTYIADTAEYRAAKFVAELGDYFSVDSVLYHYLFIERHCMVDNVAKNTFISYEWDEEAEGYRWNYRCDYDNDTADGNDNSGGLTFTYGMEFRDTIGAAHVFNAWDSVLFCNVKNYMHTQLGNLYRSLESKGAWNSTRILNKFLAYQSARPEVLYMEDAWAKYLQPYIATGETRYISMLYGTKEYQREQFEKYQEKYVASKYMGALATSDRVEFRANTPMTWTGVEPSGDVVVTMYSDCYIAWRYGGNSAPIMIRAKRNTPYTVVCPVTLGDTEVYGYLASNIKALGSLAGLYTKLADLSQAAKLQSIELGSSIAGYVNESLGSGDGNRISFGANKLLESINICGSPNLVQLLDLSALVSLKYLYATGSGITGVALASGAPLTEALLPAMRSLQAKDLTALQTFQMPGQNLTSIVVENAPAINTQALVEAATGLQRGRLIDVDWTLENPDALIPLTRLPGIDQYGEATEHFVLTGECYIQNLTQNELETITNTWPELAISYGSIVAAHTVEFQNYDGTVLNTQSVRHGAAAVNPITAGYIETPKKPENVEKSFVFTGWDTGFSNIQADTVVTAVFGAIDRTYTVRWFDGDGQEIVAQTKTVAPYGTAVFGGADLPDKGNSLWMGWDKLTTNITSDLDVYPVYANPQLPDSIPTSYDYLYSDDPNDLSAYSLDEFYGILMSGHAEAYFRLFDKVKIVMPAGTTVITDSSIELMVAGYDRFKLADGSGNFAHVNFVMCNLLSATRAMNGSNTNEGGWPRMALRTWLNYTLFPKLPILWRKLIKLVQVRSSAGNQSTEIVSCEDYLYLPSYTEVGFGRTSPYIDEIDPDVYGSDTLDAVWPVFTDNASRIKRIGGPEGTASIWWLRSPVNTSSFFISVNNGGSKNNNYYSNSSYGVAFGFSI